MKPSYDDRQLAAVLRRCAVCGAERYVTVPREGWICPPCRDRAARQQGTR